MNDKGYTVEYVPPKDNRVILLNFFRKSQEKLAVTLNGEISTSQLQEVTERRYSYYYKILLKDEKGEILFRYDDYIPNFESFEDYMHSGSSDRGRLEVDIIMRIPQGEEKAYAQALKKAEEIGLSDVKYWKRIDYSELSVRESGGIYLLSPNEEDVNKIYNAVIQLWFQIKQLMDEASKLLRS